MNLGLVMPYVRDVQSCRLQNSDLTESQRSLDSRPQLLIQAPPISITRPRGLFRATHSPLKCTIFTLDCEENERFSQLELTHFLTIGLGPKPARLKHK